MLAPAASTRYVPAAGVGMANGSAAMNASAGRSLALRRASTISHTATSALSTSSGSRIIVTDG